MSGRSYSSPAYRYGFNGQEKDDEVSGSGNTNTAEYWEYDCRLGRRWNLDPQPQINISDFTVMGNSPIYFMDPNGAFHITGEGKERKNEKRVLRGFVRDFRREVLSYNKDCISPLKSWTKLYN